MALVPDRFLTLGPVLFNWPPDQWRDFYFRVADEAPVRRVYLGEVVCAKREPLFQAFLPDVIERLQSAGKEVVLASLAEVATRNDRRRVACCAESNGLLVEANDISLLWHLGDGPFAAGPFLNVYNEDTLAFLAGRGAVHCTLPPELSHDVIASLVEKARDLRVSLEVMVHGRMPLALSARCYHARAHGRNKDSCDYVCDRDPDGLPLETVDGAPFLVINGIQTLSYTCLNLLGELNSAALAGVAAFRISPHSHGTVATAQVFHACLGGHLSVAEGLARLRETGFSAPYANGFYYGVEGHRWCGPQWHPPQ